jgi:hypothetical protein
MLTEVLEELIHQSSGSMNKPNKQAVAAYLAHSSALEIWVAHSSETSADIYKTLRRNISEHSILQICTSFVTIRVTKFF